MVVVLALLVAACGGGSGKKPVDKPKTGQFELNIMWYAFLWNADDEVEVVATDGDQIVSRNVKADSDFVAVLEDLEVGTWNLTVRLPEHVGARIGKREFMTNFEVREGEKTRVQLNKWLNTQRGTLERWELPKAVEPGMVWPLGIGHEWTYDFDGMSGYPGELTSQSGEYTLSIVDIHSRPESGEWAFRHLQQQGKIQGYLPTIFWNSRDDEYRYAGTVLRFWEQKGTFFDEKCDLRGGPNVYELDCAGGVHKADSFIIKYNKLTEVYETGIGKTSYDVDSEEVGLFVFYGRDLTSFGAKAQQTASPEVEIQPYTRADGMLNLH